MNYFNKSKLRIVPQLENNYDKILDDFNNFDYNYKDKLSTIKIDNIFNKWKESCNFGLQIDKKQNMLWAKYPVELRKKNFGHYELEVDKKIIWDGIILATKANFIKQFNITYIGRKFFSNTISLFRNFKEVITISLARFPSNRIILPHKGNKKIIRMHYGIKIPDGDIAFRVKDEEKKWENGKCFAFNDFYEHGGWNNTNDERIILIVDLDRKMIINGV